MLSLCVMVMLLGMRSFVCAQAHWRKGTATLVDSKTNAPMNGSEIKYSPFKAIITYAKHGETAKIGGLEVNAGNAKPAESDGELKVGAAIQVDIQNYFVYGIDPASNGLAYQIDWVDFQIVSVDKNTAIEKVLYQEKYVGSPAAYGKFKFDSSAERAIVSFPWKVENALNELKVNTRVGVSPRKSPRCVLDFSSLTAVPKTLRYIKEVGADGVATPSYVKNLPAGNISPDGKTLNLWEGTIIGYKVAELKTKNEKPYKPSAATPLTLIANRLPGYRLWLVTRDAKFGEGSFGNKTITYVTPVNGFDIKVERQDGNSATSFKPVASGESVLEGTQIRVTLTAQAGHECKEARELTVGYPKPESVQTDEEESRKFVCRFALADNVSGLIPKSTDRTYKVFYEKDNPGPDCTIEYVKDGAQTGPEVANGGSIPCGQDLFVKFRVPAGKSITKAKAIATDGSSIDLLVVDPSDNVYKIPAAEMRNIIRIQCETGTIKHKVRYEQPKFGTLKVTSEGNPVTSGITEIDGGRKVKVSVEDLRGDVVPSAITLVFESGPQQSHENTKSFEFSINQNVKGIDVTFIPYTVINKATEELAMALEAGYVVDENVADKGTGPGEEIISGKDRVLAGTKIKLVRKGASFPEDTFIKIEGGDPSLISADDPWAEGVVKILGNATITFEKGKTYHEVKFDAPAEGAFQLRSVGSTHVKKPAKETLEDDKEILSTWRVVDGARLKVVETGAPAGKKLLHYEVTINGKVRELSSGQEFTLNGPITSIVPKYVKACKVIYQPSGAGYSAIEVKDTQGTVIANGDLVRENTQIIVKVTPQGDHYCKEVTFNGVAKPYNKSNGVEHNVQNDVTIVPVMEELHYFSLQWEKIDGVDMEVRFDNMMGEMVPPGKKFEQLEQGRRVYVKASKEDHYLAGLRVNDDKDPYQLEDWGQWYSFALNTDITAITPVMKPFKKPGTGELLVDYSYEHAEVRVQRVVGGNRVSVPHRSLVPENEDLYITVRNIEGGYRFTCITVNQKIAHVNDQSEYKVKAVDGTLGKKVCKIGVKIDKPSNVPPRYMLVRKAEHGALKVTCTLRNGKKIDEQLTVGKPFFTVSGDEFSATLEPDEGYELGTSVFDGNDVKRKADGSLEFSSTAEQKSLLLLWAAFKATTPKSKLTWEVNGEGSVEVRDEEGNPLKSGVSLPKYAKVTVNVSVDDKHYIERFIVNNVPAGSADDFKSGKFSKRIEMDADKAMQIVFSQKLDPNPPKPSEPSTEVATDLLAGVQAFPQPMQDRLTIRHAESAVRYWLLDLMGRPLQAGQLSGAGEQVLDVVHLGPGVYLLVLEDVAGNRRTIRVVK